MRGYLILVFFAALQPLAKPISISTIHELTSSALELTKSLLEIVDFVKNRPEFMETEEAKKQRELLSKIDEINVELLDIQNKLSAIGVDLDRLTRMFNSFPSILEYELKLDRLYGTKMELEDYFLQMTEYIPDIKHYDNSTLMKFANKVVSLDVDSVPRLLRFLNREVTSPNFLGLVTQLMEPTNIIYFCKKRQSLSQVFHNLLNDIALINLKGFVVEQVAYMLRKMYQGGTFKKEIIQSRKKLMRRNAKLIATLKHHMLNASLEVRRCDPDKHQKGKTFLEVTNFLHGYVINKSDLDPKGSCKKECDVYKYVRPNKSKTTEWYKKQTACPKVINCHYVDSSMDVCLKNLDRDNRRYSYIKFGNGKTYGERNYCHTQSHLKTYRYWIIQKCSYCFCTCEEDPKTFSDRYINLRLAEANVWENKVVTGLRFVKNNRIIHLQVQEGRLMPYGQIDLSSVKWVPVDNYRITDSAFHYFSIREGHDFHTLSWEERALDLTDIKLESDSVITGVRFRKVDSRLYIEAQATPFNFTTGKLKFKESYYVKGANFKYHKFVRKLILKNPDNLPLTTAIDFTTGKYVEFTHTDFEKDAGQTTVPFFDAQEVSSAVPVPLSGIGIFHKGREGSGGYIAPRIFTYNFSPHLEIFHYRF